MLANPTAGPSATSPDELSRLFDGLAEVQAMSDDLCTDVARAVDSGAPWVGVAGGDGSLRAASTVLMAARRPLLAVPCGTKNHFAAAVGTGTLEQARAAAADGTVRFVDVGYVDDEVFLNTASLGWYAAVVRERDRRRHWPKRLADAAGVVREGLRGRRYPVEVGGERRTTWVVFAGNGRYGETLRTIAQRGDLCDGVLDLRLVLADRRWARARLVGALLASSLGRTPVVERRLVEDISISICDEATTLVALDGDAHRFTSPMRWRIERSALPVVVPAGGPAVLRSPASGD